MIKIGFPQGHENPKDIKNELNLQSIGWIIGNITYNEIGHFKYLRFQIGLFHLGTSFRTLLPIS